MELHPSRLKSPDSAEPTTPTRGPLTDVLNLTQEIVPSATPRTMRRIRNNIQAGMNEVNGLLSAKDRQIADLTNQAHTARRPRKRRRHHRAEGINESEVPNPATVEERTRSAGRRFSLLKSLFFIDDERVWVAELDDKFNRIEEFDSEDGRIQGQILDVLDVLPDDVKQWRQEEWLSLAFMDGMDGERATIGNRIRSQSLATLVDEIGQIQLKLKVLPCLINAAKYGIDVLWMLFTFQNTFEEPGLVHFL
ncbi:hypothetical protein B0H14DRAFT_2730553 [Mycena olivaceomarginata]|nr:hypothetical protein B0H14DRAFT_2730553 [Mycena olivaceomarginata]